MFFLVLTGACQFGHGVGGFTTNFIHSSAKTKRGFLTPIRSQPQLGLAVGCGDITLQQKTCLFCTFFYVQPKHQNGNIFVDIEGFRPCLFFFRGVFRRAAKDTHKYITQFMRRGSSFARRAFCLRAAGCASRSRRAGCEKEPPPRWPEAAGPREAVASAAARAVLHRRQHTAGGRRSPQSASCDELGRPALLWGHFWSRRLFCSGGRAPSRSRGVGSRPAPRSVVQAVLT